MAKKDKKSSGISKNLKLLGGLLLKKMARGGAKSLRSNADEVNKLNVFPVPDGDTGDNMRLTIESGISAIENLDSDDLAEVMQTLSHGMLLGARGNSGVILSQFFAGTAKGLKETPAADPETFARALEKGVEQAYSSVMTPTEGTILTVAREAVEYAVSRLTPESTIRSLFADLVGEMHASLDRTPEILTVLKDAGVVDSGGAGLFYIMDGFNRVLNGEEIVQKENAPVETAAAPAVDLSGFGADSVMTFGYCTELLVRLQNSKTDVENFDVEALKTYLAELGDSVVAFVTDGIVKLHVHTFTPEKVLKHCHKFGEFLTVKIENMSLQHTSSEQGIAQEEEPIRESASAAREKYYGAVAVCNGMGIENLFLEAGADVIIHGGQTHNPSAGDFLEAFRSIRSEYIYVFPNNGNILMAAQQAAELYQHAKIVVIPSKNIGTGYVALSMLDWKNEDAEVNRAAMEEAMAGVAAGYISPSIRDAELNGVHIENGDTIGILEKEIVVSEKERAEAAHQLADKMLALPDKFMLTVFCGMDASMEERRNFEAYLRDTHSDTEIYFVDGGQEIYPYILIAE